MNELLERIAMEQIKAEMLDVKRYRNLVQAIARGDAVDAAEAADILDARGLQPSALAEDVAMLGRPGGAEKLWMKTAPIALQQMLLEAQQEEEAHAMSKSNLRDKVNDLELRIRAAAKQEADRRYPDATSHVIEDMVNAAVARHSDLARLRQEFANWPAVHEAMHQRTEKLRQMLKAK